MIRWLYPFPWYNAWESYAYASGAIQPAWGGPACEPLAEVRGEVVAVFGEEVVGGALELLGGFFDDGLEFLFGPEGEAVEDCLSKGAAGWFLTRTGESVTYVYSYFEGYLLRPVYASFAARIMAPICVFLVVDNDAGVEQRAADCP
jgi:hypothetical protein